MIKIDGRQLYYSSKQWIWKQFKSWMYRRLFKYRRYYTVPDLDRVFRMKINTNRYKITGNHWDREIWPTIRKYRLHIDGYKCLICSTKGDRSNPLQCHHIRYDRLNTEYEILDVRTVCHSCHKKLHKR